MRADTLPTFQSETGRLRRVVVKHPAEAVGSQAAADAQWAELGWRGRPDYGRMCREADAFIALMRERGVEVLRLPRDEGTGMDSVYVRDASVVTDRGVILGAMGKAARVGEPAAQERAFEAWEIGIRGRIAGEGRLEGGDCVWLDRGTLLVGRGYRTNAEGIRQLRTLLEPEVTVVEVPLPHFRGPGDVFHLMSMLSPVDTDAALVYSPTLPVPFREHLLDRGLRLIETVETEYDALGPNALALEPGVALVCGGAPETARRLEAAGVEVISWRGLEISVKGSGGPTCLTRTLERG